MLLLTLRNKFNTYSRLCLISPSLGDLDVGPGDYQMNPNCLDIEPICSNKKITLVRSMHPMADVCQEIVLCW